MAAGPAIAQRAAAVLLPLVAASTSSNCEPWCTESCVVLNGNVESEEQLFASRVDCGRKEIRILGVDRRLGPIVAVELRLEASLQTSPPLHLTSIAVSHASVEYSTAVDLVLEVKN